MKNSIFLISLFILTLCKVNAQSNSSRLDTMSIFINGERITLPVPKAGNKTTINMEDSANVIQVSVSKVSKTQLLSNPLVANKLTPSESNLPVKHVSWFNEVDFGTVVFTNRNTFSSGSLYDYTIGTTATSKTRVTFIPKHVNPGITAGIVIREKRRSIGNSGLILITGSRFRYSRFVGSGDYKITELTSSRSGADSVLSINKGDFKAATNNYQFIFPYLIETRFKKNGNTKLSAGVNLIVNIHSTKYTENIRNSSANINYNNTQLLIVQPMLKVSYKSSSIYMAYNLGRTRIGDGLNTAIEGNMLYFGMAYKLY